MSSPDSVLPGVYIFFFIVFITLSFFNQYKRKNLVSVPALVESIFALTTTLKLTLYVLCTTTAVPNLKTQTIENLLFIRYYDVFIIIFFLSNSRGNSSSLCFRNFFFFQPTITRARIVK